MRLLVLIFVMLFSISNTFSQTVVRVEVLGVIIVNAEDLEGVTIYNTSSNKGTITNGEGEFKIDVALNDKIEVSALQFSPSTLKITQVIIDNKTLKVHLIEQLNTLDEVVVLPHNLTGNLNTDSGDIKVVKPMVFSFGSFSDYDMPDDHHSGVVNIALPQSPKYLMDFGKIIKLIAPSLFKRKSVTVKRAAIREKIGGPISRLALVFPNSYFVENYKIPEEKVNDFIVFVEDNGFNTELLESNKKMELIAFFHKKSKQFLKQK